MQGYLGARRRKARRRSSSQDRLAGLRQLTVGAAEQGLDLGKQYLQVKWLHDVIIATLLQGRTWSSGSPRTEMKRMGTLLTVRMCRAQ